jgi:predicted HicB family RNase H-like nuclease
METAMNEPKGIVPLVVRLDGDVHRALVAEAARNERSVNKEIRWRLKQSIQQQAAAADDRA